MKKLIIILFLFISFNIYSQVGALDDRVISTYQQYEEVARRTITFTDGFTTVDKGDLHAYIDENLPIQNYDDGYFTMNYIRVFTPLSNNSTTNIPVHNEIDYADWNEEIQYFDGLGRHIQTVNVPLPEDTISFNQLFMMQQEDKLMPICHTQ